MDFESANIGIFFDMERFGLKNMSYINYQCNVIQTKMHYSVFFYYLCRLLLFQHIIDKQ